MNALILMAGPNELFEKAGYHYSKHLIEIDGLSILQHVIEGLNSLRTNKWKFTFVVRKDEQDKNHLASMIHLLLPEAQIVIAPKQTRGAACSALLALDYINNDEPLVIINGDQLIDINLADALGEFKKHNLDAATIGFKAIHPRWSYVRTDDEGYVVEAAEKRPISNFATAGLYYFRAGKLFVNAAMDSIRKDAHVGGYFYVCPTFNELILKHARIGTKTIDRSEYHSLATPDSVVAYSEYCSRRER